MFVYFGGKITCIWVLKQSASYFLQKAVNTSNEYEIATAALFIIYAVSSSLFPDGAISVVGILFFFFFILVLFQYIWWSTQLSKEEEHIHK